MLDGLWTAIFHSGPLAGGGVICLRNGQLAGGDSQYFYVGTYTYDDQSQQLKAHARIIAFVAGAISIFGIPTNFFEITLSGTVKDNSASITGAVDQSPNLRFDLQMVKRVDLDQGQPEKS